MISDVVRYIGRAGRFFDGLFRFLGGADVAAFSGVFEDRSFLILLSGNPKFFGHPLECLERLGDIDIDGGFGCIGEGFEIGSKNIEDSREIRFLFEDFDDGVVMAGGGEFAVSSYIAIDGFDLPVCESADFGFLRAFEVELENVVSAIRYPAGFSVILIEPADETFGTGEIEASDGRGGEGLVNESALAEPAPGVGGGESKSGIAGDLLTVFADVGEASVCSVPVFGESNVLEEVGLVRFIKAFAQPVRVEVSFFEFEHGVGGFACARLMEGESGRKDGVGEPGSLSDDEPVFADESVGEV